MPNFDGGHYFLTTLAPIRPGGPDDDNRSYIQRLRQVLEDLPTAHQSPATVKNTVDSPFTRSLRTHLCRFVVIDDAVFNGRVSPNPLEVSAKLRDDPITPEHCDQLPCAYLMFAVDFDAVRKPGEPLPDALSPTEQDAIRDDYLQDLWRAAPAELTAIYQNCQDFDYVRTPEDFARYLARCQIETWMSFNDYYVGNELADVPEMPLRKYLYAIGAPALLTLLFLVMALLGAETGPMAILFGAATAAVAWYLVRKIVENGQTPLPPAEFGDLPAVLKGLYLQQRFTDFVVETQAAEPADLHTAFGRFVEEHAPQDVLHKTQPPGVIKS